MPSATCPRKASRRSAGAGRRSASLPLTTRKRGAAAKADRRRRGGRTARSWRSRTGSQTGRMAPRPAGTSGRPSAARCCSPPGFSPATSPEQDLHEHEHERRQRGSPAAAERRAPAPSDSATQRRAEDRDRQPQMQRQPILADVRCGRRGRSAPCTSRRALQRAEREDAGEPPPARRAHPAKAENEKGSRKAAPIRRPRKRCAHSHQKMTLNCLEPHAAIDVLVLRDLRYFAKASSQSACDSGGSAPTIGCHSVIERPDR